MAGHRFYSPPSTVDGSLITLSAPETHHLAHVLRLSVGDEAFVFDGRGREYRCRVVEFRKKQARLEVIAALTDNIESPLKLTLAQAIAKGDKLDVIVQKATELGVSRIIPLITRNSAVKLTAEGASKRLGRWRQISLEALKQCGRRTLVDIDEPLPVRELPLRLHRSELALAFSERGGAPLSRLLIDSVVGKPVTGVVGPEGGWSDDEIAMFEQSDFGIVTLGPRILRTETAAIVAIALLQHALGDISSQRDGK